MRLLIIGALDGQLGAASRIAMERGAAVLHAADVAGGLEVLRSGQGADVAMIDVKNDIEGLIAALASERIHVPVVACGIGSDAKAAVRAIKAGAKEYIPLPPDAEMIAAVLAAVTDDRSDLIARDENMLRVVRLAEQVAATEASVLITGESGTGKEVIAKHIHRKSKRAAKRLVAVNCAAIPEALLESELFGHEKGAFTGAVARRIGKFEEAAGGTLLLDEISEMDVRLQAKLLRAIQEREIDRVGGNQPVKVDVRLIATSNRDLQDAVRQGSFREDLFFRLNVVTLDLPPLRERPQDIEPLADHFMRHYSEANDMAARPIAKDALELLRRHSWRGNVRELENTMHWAVILAAGPEIGADAILLTGSGRAGGGAGSGETAPLVGRTVADVERDLIIDTVRHCLGNRTHAANILGISIRTLRNKLKQYSENGIDIPAPGEAGA